MGKYTLMEYVQLLDGAGLVDCFDLNNIEDTKVEYLTYDSQQAKAGTLFICKGLTFKGEYLVGAINSGAVCYVSEKKYDEAGDKPYIIVKDIRKAMPILADKFNNSAWEKLKITGFGGTKGKSTSTYYMKSVVDDYMASMGKKESAVISSIRTYDGIVNEESHLTTPEAVVLHEHFSNAVASDIEFLEMEVSSQALKYNRIDSMKLDVGVFLNISEDHISPLEHPDLEDYFCSKLRIFESSKYGVVNLDSDFSDRIVEAAKICEKVLTFSVKNEDADVYAYDIHKENGNNVFMVKGPNFDERFELTMPGLFNIENALSVICAAILLDIPMEYIKSGLYKAKTAGRMEMFTSEDGNTIAVVDYAHNKLSFEKLFSSVKEEYPEYDIVAVFGCPGGKAYNRREDLGLVSGEFSSKVYLCAEDPAKEDVTEISKDIAQYVEKQGCPYEIIEDREEAIKKAIADATGKTILLITGKGDEEYQKVGTEYAPYKSDIVIVKECLNIEK